MITGRNWWHATCSLKPYTVAVGGQGAVRDVSPRFSLKRERDPDSRDPSRVAVSPAGGSERLAGTAGGAGGESRASFAARVARSLVEEDPLPIPHYAADPCAPATSEEKGGQAEANAAVEGKIPVAIPAAAAAVGAAAGGGHCALRTLEHSAVSRQDLLRAKAPLLIRNGRADSNSGLQPRTPTADSNRGLQQRSPTADSNSGRVPNV